MNLPLRRIIFVFAVFFFLSGYSRANSGYYLKLSGDTVKGNFLNVPELGNPSSIEFVPIGATEVTVLKPGEVRSFRVGDYDHYLSYVGPRILNSTDGSASTGAVDTINTFLREIGESSGYYFFSYSDAKRVNLFYSDDGHSADELRYLSSSPMKGDYHDQLYIMLGSKVDSSKLSGMLKRLDYSEEGMINFIDELNEIGNENEGLRGFILTAGYSYNTFSATGSNAIPAVATNYKEAGSWLIGFGYIKPLRKGDGRYFIYPNIKAFTYESIGSIKRYDGFVTTKFSSELVLFPAFNVGYYLVNKPGMKFFLTPGFGFMVFMNNKEESSYEYFDGSIDSTSSEKTHVSFDVNLKTGIVVLQRFMIWAAYNIPTPVSNDSEYKKTPFTGNLSGFQGGIGVKF